MAKTSLQHKTMTPESERVKRWREANKERYNARMKAYMKDRRAREKKKREPAINVTIIPHNP